MSVIQRDSDNVRAPRSRLVLLIFAALSAVAGIVLVAWGVTRGNHLAAIIGVALIVDAGIVVWVAGRM